MLHFGDCYCAQMNVRSIPSSSLNPCARPYDQRSAVSSAVPPASTLVSPMMTPIHAGFVPFHFWTLILTQFHHHHHHHHHLRISSRRRSRTKLQGRCVSRITLMSVLLWPIVCIAVWSAEQFRLQCTLECPQRWQRRDRRRQRIPNLCHGNGDGRNFARSSAL